MITVYKIRDKSTGLYSTGGCWPSFNARGKTWSSTGPVRNHLNVHAGARGIYRAANIADWEVVEIQVSEEQLSVTSAEVFAAARKR